MPLRGRGGVVLRIDHFTLAAVLRGCLPGSDGGPSLDGVLLLSPLCLGPVLSDVILPASGVTAFAQPLVVAHLALTQLVRLRPFVAGPLIANAAVTSLGHFVIAVGDRPIHLRGTGVRAVVVALLHGRAIGR
jgi:hypothetical protein